MACDVEHSAVGGMAVAEGRRDLALFAPGPGNLAAWFRSLEIDPGLKPALPRLADGMAARLDRLRGAGNGVCPLAAAYAYRTLRAAFAGAG